MNASDKVDRVGLLLQNYVPGLPMTTAALVKLGVQRDSIARFVKRGYLKSIGYGAYCLPNDSISGAGAAAVIQREHSDVYVGGMTALRYAGIYHNVYVNPPIFLFGAAKNPLPAWSKNFSLFYRRQSLFDFSSEAGRQLDSQTVKADQYVPFGLRCSVPERAVLELVYAVGHGVTEEDAFNVLTSVLSLRKDLLGSLLQVCTSIKTTRLFLVLANQVNLPNLDLEQLVHEYELNLGYRPLKQLRSLANE